MIALPTYIDVELWAAFVESRTAMKVPFTPLAQKLVIKKLMGMHSEGWCPNASLQKSAIYGYRGVFEVARIATTKDAVDPTLAKLDADEKNRAPMPIEVRNKLAELRKGKI